MLTKSLSPNIVFRDDETLIKCLQGCVLRGVQDGAVRGEDPVADRGRLHGALVGPRQGGRPDPRLLPGGGQQVQITHPLTSSSAVFLDTKVLQKIGRIAFHYVECDGGTHPGFCSAGAHLTSPFSFILLPISSSISILKMRCNAVDSRWIIRPGGPWSNEV